MNTSLCDGRVTGKEIRVPRLANEPTKLAEFLKIQELATQRSHVIVACTC